MFAYIEIYIEMGIEPRRKKEIKNVNLFKDVVNISCDNNAIR